MKHRIRGFTLIEVMIALVILAVGLLGMASLMVRSQQSNEGAYSRSQASILAYDIIERMRANKVLASPQETRKVSYATQNSAYAMGSLPTCATPANGQQAAGNAQATQDIAQWCLAVRNSLSEQDLARIQDTTLLRHAADMAPDAFGPYLLTDASGLLTYERLPASDDPLLGHVRDIQARHEVFIDTLDEYYEALYQDVKPRYDIWRQYSFEQVMDQRDNAERARNGEGVLGTGSFESLSQNYNRYKWSKIFEQEFVALSSGFVSETAPAVLELSRNISGLSGPVEDLYAQWRVYLRELYEIETATTAP